MSLLLRALLLVACGTALAQQADPPNSVLLVAKRGLEDPRFGRSVVLVTQAPDGHTLGVILNRPTQVRHEGRRLWYGGPVMNRVVVALFKAGTPPEASAFHVLKNVYLSMHPANVDALLGQGDGTSRLYSGFSAWVPGQLRAELERDSWHLLPADEETVFREDVQGMWDELVARAEKPGT